MYKSQFRKMDPYGFVVQGHILCLIYQNIISAFVTAGKMHSCQCVIHLHLQMKLLRFLCIAKINFVDTDLICLVTAQMSYNSN